MQGCSSLATKRSSEDEVVGDMYSDYNYELVVYPNPSNGEFNIYFENESSEEEYYDLYIYDMAGNMVDQLKGSTYLETKLGTNLASGVYMLEVRQGNFRKIVRLVRQ